ncbi:MAG: glycosyltransferase family 2 protein, partial [Bacteroidetes bacterium]|nr:glycosyltransferase family 2 protein [Bacteroidota bacterium]
MDLSIIIVNHNTCELLINCITSVNGNSKTIDFEIIVVDNNSKDDSVSRMRELFPKVMIIENNQNVGFATANNQAIRDSKGEVVLLLNPDTIVVEGAIEKSYEFLCNHPDAGVVGCKLLNTDYSIQP